MRFRCGLTREQRYQERRKWHKWFAWHPVRIGNERVWLETVERQGEHFEDSLGGG